MRIVIVGGGVVGSSLAEHLLRDGHTLALIEADAELCRTLSGKHDIQVITGNGSSPRLLQEAGIDGAELVIAVTPEDEINMVVCNIAQQHQVRQRIARLRDREYRWNNPMFDLAGIGVTDVIHPEKVMVDHILQYIETPHALQSANFEDGSVLLRAYKIRDNMEMAGKTPREIRVEIAPDVVLFAAIVRNGVGMIPDGNTRIEGGDIVYSLFPRTSLDRFMKLVGQEKKKSRKIIVTGDSYALMEISRAFQGSNNKEIIVDPDREQAERIAAMFDGIDVIHGDCTDVEVLRDLNIESASFFVAVSNEADYNIMSALLAKAEGAHEVIATSSATRHDSLFKSIGIDHVINPRLTAAREILEVIARGHIGAVVQFSNVDIEAVRFTVDAGSEIAGLKIKQVAKKLKKGSIIGVIVRQSGMVIPDGETEVLADDHLIVITHHKNLPNVARLFKVRG
ncbi:MAG: Trk system potassium transporter TrkA [candidate division Zixibacteria bacterium]|nr:Trk system potassium transporter TrkA [candidate division Zixibacteria bacterium]